MASQTNGCDTQGSINFFFLSSEGIHSLLLTQVLGSHTLFPVFLPLMEDIIGMEYKWTVAFCIMSYRQSERVFSSLSSAWGVAKSHKEPRRGNMEPGEAREYCVWPITSESDSKDSSFFLGGGGYCVYCCIMFIIYDMCCSIMFICIMLYIIVVLRCHDEAFNSSHRRSQLSFWVAS